MRFIIAIVLFLTSPCLLSQELCEWSKRISKEYHIKKDTTAMISDLIKMKNHFDDKGVKLLVDMKLGKLFFDLNQLEKADSIFSKVYATKFFYPRSQYSCNYFYENDYNFPNVLKKSKEWKMKVMCLEYLSQIEYKYENYESALQKLELALKEKRKHQKRYSCANGAYQDILQYERKRFDILKKLQKDSLANVYASKVLFFPSPELLFQKQIIKSLQQEFPKKNIVEEIEKSFEFATSDSITVNGLKLEMNYLNVLNKQIMIPYPYLDEQENIKYLKKKLRKIAAK